MSNLDMDDLTSVENENFIAYLTNEIDDFATNQRSDTVLLFPPLNSYKRLLIHQLVEKSYSVKGLSTFSVGEQPRRRTVVCRIAQRRSTVDDDSCRQNGCRTTVNRNSPSPIVDKERTYPVSRPRKERKTMSYYVPPHLRKTEVTESIKAKDDDGSVRQNVEPKNEIKVSPAGDKTEIWDPKFCGKGPCSYGDVVIPILDDNELGDIHKEVGNVRVVEIEFPPDDETEETTEYVSNSIIEIYHVPSTLTTDDLVKHFVDYIQSGFRLRWVGDDRALGIFSSSKFADEALSIEFDVIKTRPIAEGSRLSKEIARSVVLPSSFRPKTSSTIAKRLLTGALGLKVDKRPQRIADV